LAPTLPANIILGWKGLQRTDTLGYYENLLITAIKSFIRLAVGHLCSQIIRCIWEK
jgi:hypothetical protein